MWWTADWKDEKDGKEIDYYIEVDKPGGRQQLRHRELEAKGQLISKGNFSVYDSPKKRTWKC